MELFVGRLSEFMRQYLSQISTALVATLLALYGGYMNEAAKKAMKNLHFLVRFMVFVLLCAFGYGAFSLLIARALREILGGVGGLYLAPIIVAAFFMLGLLAEKKNKI